MLNYYKFRSKKEITQHIYYYTQFLINLKSLFLSLIKRREFIKKNTTVNQIKWLNKIEDTMKIGGRSKRTFNNYKSHINRFLNYYDENVIINELTEDDILLYLKEKYLNLNRSEDTLNLAECSISYLFSICFNKTLNKKKLPCCKLKKRMPSIILKEDFIKMFNYDVNIKHKCWLLLAFCSGLRVSEIASLKVQNLSSKNHRIHIQNAKGKKDRYTILPNITIKFLGIYCRINNIKSGYLFPGINNCFMNEKTIINYFSVLKYELKLNNNISFHSLRHSFATYYLMNGGSLLTLQSMLGHTNLNTTTIYLHLSQNFNELEGIKYV